METFNAVKDKDKWLLVCFDYKEALVTFISPVVCISQYKCCEINDKHNDASQSELVLECGLSLW